MAARGLPTVILAALLLFACVEEGGRTLLEAGEPAGLGAGRGLEAGEPAGLGAGGGLEDGEALPPAASGDAVAPSPALRRGGGTAVAPAPGRLPAGPLFQPLLGSGADSHSAECDPFDDPFGACI